MLMVIRPEPLLVAYRDGLRLTTRTRRSVVEARIDYSKSISRRVLTNFQDDLDRIADIHDRIRARQRGIPQTEYLDAIKPEASMEPRVSDGESFLLKKAYRAAARLAHPDNGGSAEDFHAVNAAYRAKDIGSLTEFVILFEGTINDQIGYWQTEVQKPDIQWKVFQSGNEHKIAQLYMQGFEHEAMSVAYALIQITLSKAIAEDFYFQ